MTDRPIRVGAHDEPQKPGALGVGSNLENTQSRARMHALKAGAPIYTAPLRSQARVAACTSFSLRNGPGLASS